ncbi:SH3 domain-binding glutamic acid-rich-like protein 2 isoform X1 [Oryzias latipes]|uniref:SH3 domain binding glutamate-rich protein like 2 n=1 Tax=Oryzias latipes TaxID=8090 RepID=A0A3B3I173_ORYLA|nr:SH3 domain-binding glutamic acid-rich-like protein 2 isoform X1 [Oryzias latipes]
MQPLTPYHGNHLLHHPRTTRVALFYQVKKHQQAVVGFLEANRINFQEVDITMQEEQRLWMYRNIPKDKQPERGNPLPPQIFNEDHYCGDYEDFFQSKENNTVSEFLRLTCHQTKTDSAS